MHVIVSESINVSCGVHPFRRLIAAAIVEDGRLARLMITARESVRFCHLIRDQEFAVDISNHKIARRGKTLTIPRWREMTKLDGSRVVLSALRYWSTS